MCVVLPLAPVVAVVLVLGAVLITLPPVPPTLQRGGWQGVPQSCPHPLACSAGCLDPSPFLLPAGARWE